MTKSQGGAAPPLDAAVVAALARDLAAGKTDTTGQLFAANGAASPIVTWSPRGPDVRHPVLRSCLQSLGRAAGRDGTVRDTWLDSDDFAALSDWSMVLSPDPDLADFTYDLYGSQVAQAYRGDMTGARTSGFGGHIALFFTALYQAVIHRREIVKSVHEPPRQVFVRTWNRVIVPLTDASGRVVKLAAVNVADNDLAAGLEAIGDAILVAAPDGEVWFANRAACRLFDRPRTIAPGTSLAAFTGLDLTLPEDVEALVRKGPDEQLRAHVLRDRLLVPLRVAFGATYYRNRPVLVVTVRADAG